MRNKPKVMSALLLSLGVSHAHALDCLPMAKIHRVDKIDHVLILRGCNTEEWASRQNRELCAGDKVIVPKVIPHLKVAYYSYPPKNVSLKAGESHQVKPLSGCNVLCKAKDKIKLLIAKLTKTEPSTSTLPLGTRGSEKSISIFMPLASAQGAETPFYLFSRDGTIPLFWRGRQPPYRIEVTDAQGKMLVQQTVKTNTFSLTLPDTELNQRYTLRISEVGSREVPYHKPLVFAAPPFPLNPKANKFERFAALLATDCGGKDAQNWRLEIWRQLQAMPDSPEKESFKKPLAGDYFDFYGVDLCE